MFCKDYGAPVLLSRPALLSHTRAQRITLRSIFSMRWSLVWVAIDLD